MIQDQINECQILLEDTFKDDLLAVYLYGSAASGTLQKYSDIDLFVVLARNSTQEEKAKLVTSLLNMSGIYMQSEKLPLELTIVKLTDINPWNYPPKFDFQYGEWLRQQFEDGNIEPWSTKEMPDLASLITQVLLASKTLIGLNPDQLLCPVPHEDFLASVKDAIPHLLAEIDTDTRNVLLTLSRIWYTVETGAICSKPAAADWAMSRITENHRSVLARAKAIANGEIKEDWSDLRDLIKPCANFIVSKIGK